jgi:hypothetical protein
VVIAAKPPQPIEKGLPGPGLLAEVITSKYADHLPLYQLEGIFARHGAELSRKTMCGWMAESAWLLEPIWKAMRSQGLRIFNFVCCQHFGQVLIIPTTTQASGLEAVLGRSLLSQQADRQPPQHGQVLATVAGMMPTLVLARHHIRTQCNEFSMPQ